jgi:hypothetical protein
MFSKKVAAINCIGFTGGTIEARIEPKDFDDVELDGVIDGAVREYAKYRPKINISTVGLDIGGYYPVPSDALWVVGAYAPANVEVSYKIENKKIRAISCYDGGITISEGRLKIEYAVTPDVSEIDNTEMLLLCAEGLCDRIKAEEPDRWAGISVSIQGIDKLDVSTEFRQSAESKMREFRKQMGVGYGCTG